MRLYLVQHGEAKSEEVDPERSLTEAGREATEKMADLASRLGLEVNAIRHSGKTRARQTAEIFGKVLSPSEGVKSVEGLGPVDDVAQAAGSFKDGYKNIMLVGHLPFMEKMVAYLTTGDPEKDVIEFHNSGVVCLEGSGEDWMVSWQLLPGKPV
jgi:phosphohistidine phosphatase